MSQICRPRGFSSMTTQDLVRVPLPLSESDDWLSSSEQEQLSLIRRLYNFKVIGQSLSSGSRFEESSDLIDFLEDLELDIAAQQELETAHRGGLSRWLIHNSWSFDTSPAEMIRSLPVDIRELIDMREPPYDATVDVCLEWFKHIGDKIVYVIDEFGNAKSFALVIAMHIVVDILAARTLLVCYKLRLNECMPE